MLSVNRSLETFLHNTLCLLDLCHLWVHRILLYQVLDNNPDAHRKLLFKQLNIAAIRHLKLKHGVNKVRVMVDKIRRLFGLYR